MSTPKARSSKCPACWLAKTSGLWQKASKSDTNQGYHDRKEHKITGKVPLIAKDHSERREWQDDKDASAQKQSMTAFPQDAGSGNFDQLKHFKHT